MAGTTRLDGACRRALMLVIALCALAGAAAPAQAAPSLRGVQLHALWPDVSDSGIDQELDLSKQANANVIRVDVGWASLEDQAKGQWNSWYLPRLDRLINGAAQRGMKVIATVWGTPCWASSAPATVKQNCTGSNWWGSGVQYPPTNASDYGDVLKFIAARYGDKLAAIEIWNEPNEGTRFLNSPDNAAAYAALVKAGYQGVKAGNANVPVLAGSLAHADDGFLSKLYADGIKGSFDGISIHPYNDNRAPTQDGSTTASSFSGGIAAVHNTQVSNGDQTPLWITEFGWTTASGTSWQVSEAQQATYDAAAFAVLDGLNYVAAATVYELRDRSSDSTDFESNFGLLNADYSPKPAYAAVQAQLALAPGTATVPTSLVSSTTATTTASSTSTSPTSTTTTSPTTTTTTTTTVARKGKPTKSRSLTSGTTHTSKRLWVKLRWHGKKLLAYGRVHHHRTIRMHANGCGGSSAYRVVHTTRAGWFFPIIARSHKPSHCSVTVKAGSLRATARSIA